jgi:protein ImuB
LPHALAPRSSLVPAERTCCVWCPAWPVATARHDDPSLIDVALAVVERGTRGLVVRAASAEARTEGVKIGLRKREAEARCAGLVVLDADPVAEARAFEILARAIEPVTPAVVLERPGVLSFPTRGPSRYFGGDEGLCTRVLEAIKEVGTVETRVGIADGAFAARLAARTAGASASAVIPPGESGQFLAPWSVGVLAGVVTDGEALALLLERLGLPTLGDLAGLAEASVLARFGVDGARAHRLARGLAEHTAPPVPPPPDLAETCEFDPPAERVDEVAFAFKALADQLLSRLDALGLSCTHVVVEAETEHGEHLARCWRHEGVLTPAALVARIRWQLDGWLTATGGLSGGLTLVRLAPERVVPATSRQLGFWGGDAAAHDRADRALARLQGMLGEDAVVTAVVCGGRAPSERVRWVPWGEPRESGLPKGAEQPAWPGAVPGPAPARVHAPPVPAELLDGAGAPVTVSSRGEASAPPSFLRSAVLPGGGGVIAAWAGPWAHDLRWWDRVTRRRRALWQIVVRPDGAPDDSEGSADVACLVVLESGRAAIEAVYD